MLNVADDVTRACLAAVADISISGRRVVRELTALIAQRDKPEMIVSDNATEHQQRRARVVRQDRRRIALHHAGAANAERLRREGRLQPASLPMVACGTGRSTRRCS